MAPDKASSRRLRPRAVLLAVCLVWLPVDVLTCAPSVTYRSGTPVSLLRDAMLCVGHPRDGGVAFSLRKEWSVQPDGSVVLIDDSTDEPAPAAGSARALVHYRWGGIVHQLWFSERGEFDLNYRSVAPLTPEQLAQLTRLMADEIAIGHSNRNGTPVQRQLAIDALNGNPRTVTEWYWQVLALDAVFIASATYTLWSVLAWHARRCRAKSA